MAIAVLVRAMDSPASVPIEARWRTGHIVSIRQAPAPWGLLETLPRFWRITIQGIDLTDPAIDTWLAQRLQTNQDGLQEMVARRQLYLEIANLPAPVRNDITADGIADIAANRLQGFRDAMIVRP